MNAKRYWWKAVASFLFVLFMMPLGHALMIIMEHLLDATALHYAAFAMGACGMLMVIAGIFVRGDTRQTLWGLFGALLFWTGWVEFLFMYYAGRFGTQPLLDPLTGEVVTRPEYLIMPASFGFWMMVMILYVFCVSTGCGFIRWWQRLLPSAVRARIAVRPLARHTSVVTFMELIMILWASYLLLMFCYDDRFLGDRHPVTLLVGLACLVASFFIFARQLRIPSWGASVRMAIPAVIVFWTPVEILGRINFLQEIWVAPLAHKGEMTGILVAFLLLAAYLWYAGRYRKKHLG